MAGIAGLRRVRVAPTVPCGDEMTAVSFGCVCWVLGGWVKPASERAIWQTVAPKDNVSTRTAQCCYFLHHIAVHADVAQLVAHHLAKVRVASSSLVIRSGSFIDRIPRD